MEINGANNSQLDGFFEGLSPVTSNNHRTCDGLEADACLQSDYASLTSRAIQMADNQSDAVQNAGELLASGELDSGQAARATAENILTFGI